MWLSATRGPKAQSSAGSTLSSKGGPAWGSNKFIKGVACPSCFDKTTQEQKNRYMSRQRQVELAKERNTKHIGPKEDEIMDTQ